MPNQLLTIAMITNESLDVLENQLGLARWVNREYSDEYAKQGAKIGATVSVRLPSQFTGRVGAAISIEDDSEIMVPVTLTTQAGVDVEFSSQELTLSLDNLKKRVLTPQMANIANRVDSDGCALYTDLPNEVGTPGSAPATLAAILAAGQRMNEECVPDDGQRYFMMDPRSNAAMVNGLSTLFNAQGKISGNYSSGNLTDLAGFKVGMDQNIFTHTVGPLGGAPAVNGANQGLTSGWSESMNLVTNAWTAAVALRARKGDVFTLPTVFAVNPQSRRSTNVLRQFVVNQDASSDVSGNVTLNISPAIIAAGQYQNVTNFAANGALMTFSGTASTGYPKSLAFHRNCFTLVTVDLLLPGGVDMAARKQDNGISMRLVRAYDINTDRFPSRFDILYGWRTLRRSQGVRVTG